MKVKYISFNNMFLKSFSLTIFITAIISTAILTTQSADAQAQPSSPGYNEYHADTNELIQLLSKGHYNVQLDNEAWERLIR